MNLLQVFKAQIPTAKKSQFRTITTKYSANRLFGVFLYSLCFKFEQF